MPIYKRQCTWMRGWENLISFDLHQRDEATEELKSNLIYFKSFNYQDLTPNCICN